MKRKRKWRHGGRPRQHEQVSRSRNKQLLRAAVKDMIPGKGEHKFDADDGVRTDSSREHGRLVA